MWGGERSARAEGAHTTHWSCELWDSIIMMMVMMKKKKRIFTSSSPLLRWFSCSALFHSLSLTHSFTINQKTSQEPEKKNVNEARDVEKKKEHREVKKEYLKTGFFLSKWFQSNWIQMMLRRWWWGVREKMLCFFRFFSFFLGEGEKAFSYTLRPQSTIDRQPNVCRGKEKKENNTKFHSSLLFSY